METGFEFVRSQTVQALNLTVEEYNHISGAKHFHLANDYAENVFMVAFRTVPEDSTGVAHVLEHTALCGSEKFPVRDPFFSMIRRSLNTFMNAFTTSDYTAYPFASQNRKDYFNLMEVYLDAVFFSRLDPLDFAQEGHRIEFETSGDASSPLTHKGVVYNEMKGDSSSPISRLYHAVQETLYPTSTYHFNSGGDPAVIPLLSYDDLMTFYRTHYHPANAVFMTFGDISVAEQQEKINSLALNRLSAGAIEEVSVRPETRYDTPINRELSYPVDDDDLSSKTHIVLAWLLEKNTDIEVLLKGHLLSDVLLDTSASPLRQALEKSDLATAVSPMCGFEEDHMEMNFMCGVEGSEPEHAEAIETLVLETLEKVAEEGVPQDRLEAVLHQLELSQREVGGDGMPYGLQLIFSCMSAAIHRGNPIGLLDMDSALAKLRQEILDPAFIKNLVREMLLDNPHRVRVIMKPSRELGALLIQEEADRLASIRQGMNETDCDLVIKQAAALEARQSAEEDLDLLPKVTTADVPLQKHFPSVPLSKHGNLQLAVSTAGTNGLSYHQIVTTLPALQMAQLELLPVYSQVVTEVGSAGRDYMETQHLQHSVSGGISSFSSIRSALEDAEKYQAYTTLSSRTLNREAPQMARLLRETFLEPRFDEVERLTDLIQQLSHRRMNGIASSGHQYAMLAAASSLSPVTALNDFLTGVPAVMRLNGLARSLDDEGARQSLAVRFSELHQRLRSVDPLLLLISDPGYVGAFTDEIVDIWSGTNTHGSQENLNLPSPAEAGHRAFVVTTQVNYCAAAYPTVAENQSDSAVLAILAGVLRNNYLHPAIREKGGAYGGGAGHDTNGVFRFYSYRDPRINETFADFDASIDWLLGAEITDAMLEEAVLGVISSVDSPGSPAGEIRQAFHHQLFGRDAEHRQTLRSRYLEVRQSDLRRVTERYLTSAPSLAVVTSENRLTEIDDRFEIVRVNESA
ncbi:MAG: peptidase M16 [Gammaproteobacteria bacterium]|nr:peptidase M16 [Gammaproteobacteria bacterium]